MVYYYFSCYIKALEFQTWNKLYLHLCHMNIGVYMSGGNKIRDEKEGGKLC